MVGSDITNKVGSASVLISSRYVRAQSLVAYRDPTLLFSIWVWLSTLKSSAALADTAARR
jgi:hypothetical protein